MPRILVVGAGAVGGYFGGRLLEAGRDVTFLVRQGRAAQLATAGLAIRSPHGDVTLPAPSTVIAGELRAEYELILLTCKAYDLEEAVRTLAPAVGPDTAILPLLNGMAHLDLLEKHFGAASVLGGFCLISSTIGSDGVILHLNSYHSLVFGERDGTHAQRVAAIVAAFDGVRADVRASSAVLHEMWEKWTFIGALAGITSLLRAPVGDIMAAGAAELATGLLDECAAIAAAEGFPPSPATMERSRAMLTEPGSLLAASMLRDLERRGPTEGGHIVGDLLRRGRARSVPAPILGAAAAHLRSYEARRIREAAG
jgi:2-dehydropantoate 2-reductase